MASKVLGAVQANLLWMVVSVVVGAGVFLAAHRNLVPPSTVPVPAVRQGQVPTPAQLLPFITRRGPMSPDLI